MKQTITKCLIKECAKGRPIKQGYCSLHYQRFKTTGDPLKTKVQRGGYSHGMSNTPTWHSWRGMIERVNNRNYKQFMDYGGRGIRVCDRWSIQKGFLNFLADMSIKPVGTTLDRINNDGDYEPNNCRWATYHEQNLNRRSKKREIQHV